MKSKEEVGRETLSVELGEFGGLPHFEIKREGGQEFTNPISLKGKIFTTAQVLQRLQESGQLVLPGNVAVEQNQLSDSSAAQLAQFRLPGSANGKHCSISCRVRSLLVKS